MVIYRDKIYICSITLIQICAIGAGLLAMTGMCTTALSFTLGLGLVALSATTLVLILRKNDLVPILIRVHTGVVFIGVMAFLLSTLNEPRFAWFVLLLPALGVSAGMFFLAGKCISRAGRENAEVR